MSKTLITSGKRKQILRLIEDGLDKVELDDVQAQYLIEHGDELQTGLKELLERLSVIDRFADEEATSSYVYPSGYTVRGLTEQVSCLRELFSGIGAADEKLVLQQLPTGAEGYFAIPRWEKVASTYGEAVEKVLGLIAKSRKFYNYCEGRFDPQYLRQHMRTTKMFAVLGDTQKDHDILVVPSQLGLRHRGRSVRRVREILLANEFGLGAFSVGIMLLTHPERLVHYDNLWIDCPGDEYAPGADGGFRRAPCFCFKGDRVGFDTSRYDVACGDDGSASAFLPQ